MRVAFVLQCLLYLSELLIYHGQHIHSQLKDNETKQNQYIAKAGKPSQKYRINNDINDL